MAAFIRVNLVFCFGVGRSENGPANAALTQVDGNEFVPGKIVRAAAAVIDIENDRRLQARFHILGAHYAIVKSLRVFFLDNQRSVAKCHFLLLVIQKRFVQPAFVARRAGQPDIGFRVAVAAPVFQDDFAAFDFQQTVQRLTILNKRFMFLLRCRLEHRVVSVRLVMPVMRDFAQASAQHAFSLGGLSVLFQQPHGIGQILGGNAFARVAIDKQGLAFGLQMAPTSGQSAAATGDGVRQPPISVRFGQPVKGFVSDMLQAYLGGDFLSRQFRAQAADFAPVAVENSRHHAGLDFVVFKRQTHTDRQRNLAVLRPLDQGGRHFIRQPAYAQTEHALFQQCRIAGDFCAIDIQLFHPLAESADKFFRFHAHLFPGETTPQQQSVMAILGKRTLIQTALVLGKKARGFFRIGKNPGIVKQGHAAIANFLSAAFAHRISDALQYAAACQFGKVDVFFGVPHTLSGALPLGFFMPGNNVDGGLRRDFFPVRGPLPAKQLQSLAVLPQHLFNVGRRIHRRAAVMIQFTPQKLGRILRTLFGFFGFWEEVSRQILLGDSVVAFLAIRHFADNFRQLKKQPAALLKRVAESLHLFHMRLARDMLPLPHQRVQRFLRLRFFAGHVFQNPFQLAEATGEILGELFLYVGAPVLPFQLRKAAFNVIGLPPDFIQTEF